jgi:dihydroxy-acid dehydratase
MACETEALGLMLPGGATPPAPSAARLRHGTASGRAAVAMTESAPALPEVLTLASFHNALVVLAALGGSTNAVIHLTAIARRAGIAMALDDAAATSETYRCSSISSHRVAVSWSISMLAAGSQS